MLINFIIIMYKHKGTQRFAIISSLGNIIAGNVIKDGEEIQNSHGVQNAQFGIKKDGALFFG